MSDGIFEPEVNDTVGEQIGELMQQANESLSWARKQAQAFLEHASFLEERANSFRKLAHDMVMEAHAFNEEIAMMITAEFPMDLPEFPEGEDEVEVEVE